MADPPRTVRAPILETAPADLVTGILFTADPRTGKSVLMKRMRGDAIARRDRMMVLDLSGGDELESTEWQALRVPGYEVAILDPPMTDSWGWIFSRLIETETARLYMAGKIFPDIKGDQSPYFNLNARDVFFAVLCILAHFKGDCDLHDAIRLAYNLGLLGYLADLIPHLGDPVRRFGDTKGAHDVMSTVRMRLAPLKPVAALMSKATKKVDLLNHPGAVVLVGRNRDAPVWKTLYSLVFDLFAVERLERPRPDFFWIFFDEFRQLDPVNCLSALLRMGGKTNTIVAATLHSVNRMYDRYSEYHGKEILNLFGRKVFLKTGCPDTAR